MKTDSLFYRLFQEMPELVFELAGWELPAGVHYKLHAEEVKQTSFRLDGLLIPQTAELTAPVVFLEVQFQTDTNLYGRCFSELCLWLYRQQCQRPWRLLVVFPNRTIEEPPPVCFEPFLQLPWVQRVYLEDLADQPTVTTGRQLLQLIMAEPAVAVSRAQAILTTPIATANTAEARALLEWVETILVYKLPQLKREEIQTMIHLPDIDLKQTRFYLEAFDEGRVEGQLQGQAQGQAQGQKKEAVTLILRMLRRRLGPLDTAQETKIQSLPLSELEALGEALLDFHNMAELTAWLQQPH